MDSQESLYALYETWEDQRIKRAIEKLGALAPGAAIPDMEPDDYADWLVKRGICPHAIVTRSSQYHFENSVLLDTEMGLNLPDPKLGISETPELFFQALRIVRSERAKAKEEENAANNSNTDSG